MVIAKKSRMGLGNDNRYAFHRHMRKFERIKDMLVIFIMTIVS